MTIQRCLTALLTLALLTLPVLAQQAQQAAPAPKLSRTMPTLIALGIIVFIGIAAFMTPKRGHQD